MAAFLSLLRRLYLTAYNWILFAGWCQVLFLTLKTLKESGHAHVYSNIHKPLLFAQTAALLEESGLYSVRMPNKWNFSFSYFYVAFGVLAVYVPGVPHLYNHMLRQRKKTLSKPKEE